MIPLSITTNIQEANLRNESFQTYPNPATSNMSISFELTENSQVEVNIYDVVGAKVRSLDNSSFNQGFHTITTDVSDLKKGMYFIQINTGKSQLTEKVFVQ